MPEAKQDTIALAADTTAVDTLPNPAAMHIIMDKPATPPPRGTLKQDYNAGLSWVILVLATLFVLIAMRFRHNLRFGGSMLRELTDSPSTGRLFDDTMRETAFTVLLNLLCVVSSGVLLWQCVGYSDGRVLSSPADMLLDIALCMACTFALYCGQRIAYFCIGRIFFTPLLTRLWLRAFSASQGVVSFILLPLSLLTLFYPATIAILLIPALIAWFLARMMFVIKGTRIFSGQGGGFLGFLYYLCGVEIIPVVITWTAALILCRP